jgi:protein-S-isoprenylcysteine O-methyltransferase Ste14
MTDPGNSFIARGGLWVIAQFLLMVSVFALGNRWRCDWSVANPAVAGFILFGAGLAIFLAGFARLGRNLTPFTEPRPDAQFVRSGIYAFVRHPLYTGVMMASLGWAVRCQSLASLAAALLLIPFFHAKTRREERWLCRKFPEYADYMKRVPRFLPRLGRRQNRL